MKIIHFHKTLNIGGIDTLVCSLANNMAREHDVSICTFLKLEEREGLRSQLENVHYLSLGHKRLTVVSKIFDMFKIYRLLKKGKYDIVQLHGAFPFFIIAIALLHKKTRFFYTVHSDATKENTPLENKLLRFKKKYFQKGWLHPITISKTSQESFKKLYQCESELIENGLETPCVYNSVNPILDYKYSNNTRIFVHAGRLSVAKNQKVLCQVFRRLITEGRDVVLLIIGPKDDQLIYEELLPFFNNRIVYLGPQNDVPSYFYFSDAMCLPSIFEGLPITLLESLSVGCIPICSPVGGIVDVIQNEENGILSKSESFEDYYQAILKWLSFSESENMRIRNNAKETFKKYDIIHCVNKYLKVYNNTML